MIEIVTPVWASLYEEELASLVDEYPTSDGSFDCTSTSFTTVITTVVTDKIQLSYTGLLNEQTASIEVQCVFWKNPVS
jgi:hypothetical protein